MFCSFFADLPFLLLLQDAEVFAREIWAIHVLGIENIAKFVTGKAINSYLFKPDPTPFPCIWQNIA